LIGRGVRAPTTELIDANPALVAGFFNCSRAAFVFAAEALAHGNPLKAAAHDALRDESFKCRITIAVD
jgi:predicted hotdog family 3-hydroxylacyl-ACP dehydratase